MGIICTQPVVARVPQNLSCWNGTMFEQVRELMGRVVFSLNCEKPISAALINSTGPQPTVVRASNDHLRRKPCCMRLRRFVDTVHGLTSNRAWRYFTSKSPLM